MKIRALTGFLDPGWPVAEKRIASLTAQLQQLKTALEDVGYDVQTLRLATPPPAEMESPVPAQARAEFAQELESICFLEGIDYLAIGPTLPGDLEGFAAIPEILRSAETVFTNALYAEPDAGLSLESARLCAGVIKTVSSISPDGFANLRFAALANVPAGTPFFPAAYHRGGPPTLGVATEAADLAVEAFQDAESLNVARRRLVRSIDNHAASLVKIIEAELAASAIRFEGLDFSLAPYPESRRSLGTALEALGPQVGMPGSAAAAAFLAESIDQAQFPRTGFCGLFLPVLEDSVLARRVAEGSLTLSDLLLYATVCGTGLDTIPLAGDVSEEALAGLLIDLGALALRHHKPLTARLMPIPGALSGDPVRFDFPYFADSVVMELPSSPLDGLLGSGQNMLLGPRRT